MGRTRPPQSEGRMRAPSKHAAHHRDRIAHTLIEWPQSAPLRVQHETDVRMKPKRTRCVDGNRAEAGGRDMSAPVQREKQVVNGGKKAVDGKQDCQRAGKGYAHRVQSRGGQRDGARLDDGLLRLQPGATSSTRRYQPIWDQHEMSIITRVHTLRVGITGRHRAVVSAPAGNFVRVSAGVTANHGFSSTLTLPTS